MYKFVNKTDGDYFKAAVFYNGQKLTEFMIDKERDEFYIAVEDGNLNLRADWHDYEESD
jgi:hypothetical protein